MTIIYEPKGKAREYSPHACNIYLGCNHGCLYCFAPAIGFKKREDYLKPIPRKNIVEEFKKNCESLKNFDSQVQFCFMTDPYNSLEMELGLTRQCLEIALENKIPISILTKSSGVLRDLDTIKEFGRNISVGFTLTFDNIEDSLLWEPEAITPDSRISALKTLKGFDVITWASFEPVVIPEQSLSMIQKSLEWVDIYKVGKLNNYKGMDKKINWPEFLQKSVDLLRANEKQFYVKKDLRENCPGIQLLPEEVDQDRYNLKGWKQ